jgi:NAD(P)-dependent dehydrogenase (short-subunit alcohol dehydrogenase family)
MSTFTDRTLVVSGGSRGIGLAIALGTARKGFADAAVEILSRSPAEVNGQCFTDVDVQTSANVTDLSSCGGGDNPILDIFVDKS